MLRKGLTEEQVVELRKFEVNNDLELKRLALDNKKTIGLVR